VWNAPTWFLSALTFAMVVLPHVLPAVAALRRKGLKWLLALLTGVSLLGKLAYSYDLGAWSILEGVTPARAHPNLLLWNVTRFHPFYALVEVLMGVAAARLVMTEGVDDEGRPLGSPPPPPASAALPALALLGITLARAAGYLPLNDPLTRGALFVPLFTLLLTRLHRNTLAGARGLTAFLSHPALTYLGTISFPIFIVHGALGQLFYKKIVATKVWGGVMPLTFFPAYCAIVLVFAAACQKLFLVSSGGVFWGGGGRGGIGLQQIGRRLGQTLASPRRRGVPAGGPGAQYLLRIQLPASTAGPQENKRVQEISGSIAKSITNALTA
jgi:peptidoglycan/LPS O-acetylase OafA/YrhL